MFDSESRGPNKMSTRKIRRAVTCAESSDKITGGRLNIFRRPDGRGGLPGRRLVTAGDRKPVVRSVYALVVRLRGGVMLNYGLNGRRVETRAFRAAFIAAVDARRFRKDAAT